MPIPFHTTCSARVGYLPDLNARLRALQAGGGADGRVGGGGGASVARPLTLGDFLPAPDAAGAGGVHVPAAAEDLDAMPATLLGSAAAALRQRTERGAAGAYDAGGTALQPPSPSPPPPAPLLPATTSVPLAPSSTDDDADAGGGSSYAQPHRVARGYPAHDQPPLVAPTPQQKRYAVPVGAPLPSLQPQAQR